MQKGFSVSVPGLTPGDRVKFNEVPAVTVAPGASGMCGPFLVTNNGKKPATMSIENGRVIFDGSDCVINGAGGRA